ncbi:hypothetical protein JZ751_016086 [Albula glossodonta]|uniref:Uncharacterized protein n=1 Tax=Albula glossodonta TaxID=121402 RepID=A0A8T2NR00_9TELE|nr:hypothetical protein JZ751_016086 [Albula glossodonta]
MNKLKLGRVRKGEPVRQRRHSLPVTGLSDAETKRKYKIGNPALTPGQEENILEFKLLPKSFSFEDGSFSKSSEGKGLREVRSPSASMQSGTIFQEFKKKYMEKARK